jgi:Domain of unknown function DUF29
MVIKAAESLESLYETDETAWLDAMAELVRAGRLSMVDCPHLAEYLEGMAKRDRKEVSSRLRILLVHVLKWLYQKKKRTSSWQRTVLNQQAELEQDMASGVLRKYAEESFTAIYSKAVKIAVRETGLSSESFPAECPWSLDDILADEILDR